MAITGAQLIVQGINGISYGLLLFLMSSGLSLIFGLMGVINLAHGSYYMVAAYIGLSVLKYTGSFLLAVAAGIATVAVIGALMERLFLRQLYRQELDQVLMTFGFVYIFMDLAKWLWGGDPQALDKPALLAGSVSLGLATVPTYRLALILVGLLVALLFWLFIEKTRLGAMVRAGVDDREMVVSLGININRVFAGIFTLGAALAALGGVIGGPVIGAYPGVDLDVLILALVVVVVGGLGTLKGALLGSLAIGLVDTFGKSLFPDYAIFVIYTVMAAVLFLKPEGLLGRRNGR